MTYDHPDFYTPTIPSQPVYGEGQTSWFLNEEGNIDGDSYADYLEYTVPTGYELHVTSGGICNNFPGITRYAVYVSGVLQATAHYNQYRRIALHPAAAFVLAAGYLFTARIYNDDDVSHFFTATMYGFLVEVA